MAPQMEIMIATPSSGICGTSSNVGQIPLSVLIEFIVQRTYHDLCVMSELLSGKTDLERKIEIFNFSSRTRMILIRLLAIVKWASSISKVDKCNAIMSFLDRQSFLFEDTANSMAVLARDTMVRATLPAFNLQAASEILSTGYYSKVPRCIRDKIVPSPKISRLDARITLLRLNQVIENRLVCCQIPTQMRNLLIANGSVIFTVKHEFEAALTVSSEGNVPWRLLSIKILIKDRETGEGKNLVHPLHLRYIEQVVQCRLMEVFYTNSASSLQCLYDMIHAFCQYIQLDTLHLQTQKLCLERLGNLIRIEEYLPGRCITVSYWRELMKRDPPSEFGFRFSVSIDPVDISMPLSVIHAPSLLTLEESELTEKTIRSDSISMERLLVHTIYIRTKARLADLRAEIQKRLNLGYVEATLHGSPAVLSIPILQPCLRSEQLLLTIDTYSGIILAHVPQYETNPFCADIQQTLNGDRKQLESLVSQLRYWITQQRVKKTLQQLPATSFENLPLVFGDSTEEHPIKDLSSNKMFIKLNRHPNSVLIIEFFERLSNHSEIEYAYYLLSVKPCTPYDVGIIAQEESNRIHLQAMHMMQLDSSVVTTHGRVSAAHDQGERIILGKRKSHVKVDAPIKRTKYPAYFISQLAHVVAFVDERLSYARLCAELSRRGVAHSGVEVTEKASGLQLRIIKIPVPSGIETASVFYFRRYIIQTCTVRMVQQGGGRFWNFEFTFSSDIKPIYVCHDVGSSEKSTVETVGVFLAEWSKMLRLFIITSANANNFPPSLMFSCNFRHVTFRYETNWLARLTWDSSQFRYQLTLLGIGCGSAMSPCGIIRRQLEEEFNVHRDLAHLYYDLCKCHSPLHSLSRLPTTPQMGVTVQRSIRPIPTFDILPQASSSHLKIVFYNSYCLDMHICEKGMVLLRDGAISLFDQRMALEEMQPIPWLKSFLSKYIDESNYFHRRLSQTEDDNPPSPMAAEPQKASARSPTTPQTMPSQQLDDSRNRVQPIPSPSGFMVPSPMNAAPTGGSPFPTSPMAIGSPSQISKPKTPAMSVSQGSRVLPQRFWAGSHPTPLSPSAMDELCCPVSLGGPALAPIHRYLGSLYLQRHLLHLIKHEPEMFTQVASTPNQQGVVAFKTEGLQCRVAIGSVDWYQSLHLKIIPDHTMENHWNSENILLIERFFGLRVASAPYRPNGLIAFFRLLHCPVEVLKDIIQILKYDLDNLEGDNKKSIWNCRICLTVPPSAPQLMPFGQSGVIRLKEKILMFLCLSRRLSGAAITGHSTSVVLPIVYDISVNQTSIPQKEPNHIINAAQQHLIKLSRSGQLMMNRCTLFPCVYDLLTNFVLPHEISPLSVQEPTPFVPVPMQPVYGTGAYIGLFRSCLIMVVCLDGVVYDRMEGGMLPMQPAPQLSKKISEPIQFGASTVAATASGLMNASLHYFGSFDS